MSPTEKGDFRNVFKFHAYSVSKRLFLATAKLVRGLSDVATTNVHAKWIPAIEITLKEAGEWNGWSLGLGRRNPLIWIHYESPLLYMVTKCERIYMVKVVKVCACLTKFEEVITVCIVHCQWCTKESSKCVCVCVWVCICRKTRTLSRHPTLRPWTHHQTWTSADWGASADGC